MLDWSVTRTSYSTVVLLEWNFEIDVFIFPLFQEFHEGREQQWRISSSHFRLVYLFIEIFLILVGDMVLKKAGEHNHNEWTIFPSPLSNLFFLYSTQYTFKVTQASYFLFVFTGLGNIQAVCDEYAVTICRENGDFASAVTGAHELAHKYVIWSWLCRIKINFHHLKVSVWKQVWYEFRAKQYRSQTNKGIYFPSGGTQAEQLTVHFALEMYHDVSKYFSEYMWTSRLRV